MPPFFDFLSFGIATLAFFLISIIVPGFFIWVAFKVLRKDRGILHCGFANFAAFLVTAVVSLLLHFTPLVVFLPLIAFILYLYILKTLLDVSFLEAFLATIIAGVIIFLTAIVLMVLFGAWMLFFTPPPSMHPTRF
ncbi:MULTISPECIES: hypothetical protein [unclassified Archaeoglobus]|uniref:hypothetical protein n=1 Tax=unclassified Archaeoglobus TaxID=2643606 RepID=UPI0025C48624|nr:MULTISPECIES: hypothetical protein [unclassified Archaeoglobus]